MTLCCCNQLYAAIWDIQPISCEPFTLFVYVCHLFQTLCEASPIINVTQRSFAVFHLIMYVTHRSFAAPAPAIRDFFLGIPYIQIKCFRDNPVETLKWWRQLRNGQGTYPQPEWRKCERGKQTFQPLLRRNREALSAPKALRRAPTARGSRGVWGIPPLGNFGKFSFSQWHFLHFDIIFVVFFKVLDSEKMD